MIEDVLFGLWAEGFVTLALLNLIFEEIKQARGL